MLIKLGVAALLILAYVVVAALELATNILAPIIVVGIAAVLFIPFKKNEDKTKR